ncbi:MAG: F0F1 ATP synthase subunit delta [Coxiellaceae bacterium]|nr:MAG: F0F1 ATP synthase subunit delta [Coxiellaceae bacterium]
MTELTKLARPYAQAVFDVAQHSKQIPQWSTILQNLATIVQQPLVKQLLQNPRCTPQQLAQVCIDLLGQAVPAEATNFIKVLAENRRLVALPAVAQLFDEYRKESEKSITAEVFSAVPLEEKNKQQLASVLQQRFGQNVVLECHEDPTLIGGLMVRVGDKVLDGSIRGQFVRMREELISQ